ncbi:MAG: alpha/beta fold hydrolase [Steroidobacteraceae bacterium]
MSTVVVYVHGLWLTGLEGALLRRRLARDLAAETRAFSYRSVRSTVTANAQALAKFLLETRADTLHLVGHSLGGLVILKLFENGDGANLAPGRIVLLGSPLRGSSTAHKVARLPCGRKILGRGVHEELLSNVSRRWDAPRDLGVIAGNLSIGLGRLVGVHGAPSDGTILVDETRLDGMSQHLVVRASHTGLPFSAEVARQTGAFLRTGRFSP